MSAPFQHLELGEDGISESRARSAHFWGHGYFQRAFLALVLQGRLLFPGLPATPRSVIPVPQGLPPGTEPLLTHPPLFC